MRQDWLAHDRGPAKARGRHARGDEKVWRAWGVRAGLGARPDAAPESAAWTYLMRAPSTIFDLHEVLCARLSEIFVWSSRPVEFGIFWI